MPYTYKTLAQARTDLAARLFDPSMTFWTSSELTRYIQEAISTFNVYANYWRSEFVLQSVVDTVWYDITDPAAAPDSIRTRPVFSTAYLNVLQPVLQNHMLEPVTNPWSGSTMFSESVVQASVQRATDEAAQNSGCYVRRTTIGAVAGRTYVPDSVFDIRRIAWLPAAGFGYVNTPLWPDDAWAMESFNSGYTVAAPGTPQIYQQSTEPQLSFDVDVPPAVPGVYELLSTQSAVLNTADGATRCPMTSDWLWVIKFGAMMDLLSRESQAKDSMRAQYCALRFKQGTAALLNSPSVMIARLNNIPIAVDSVQNNDNYKPTWQSDESAQPDTVLLAGQNLMGLSVTPDDEYGVTLSVVRNAVLPVADGDDIPVSRGDYEAIIDYAHHLASFKMGGSEFAATIPQYLNFVKQAALYNSKLMTMGEFSDVMVDLAKLQDQANPRYSLTTDPVTQAQQEGAGN